MVAHGKHFCQRQNEQFRIVIQNPDSCSETARQCAYCHSCRVRQIKRRYFHFRMRSHSRDSQFSSTPRGLISNSVPHATRFRMIQGSHSCTPGSQDYERESGGSTFGSAITPVSQSRGKQLTHPGKTIQFRRGSSANTITGNNSVPRNHAVPQSREIIQFRAITRCPNHGK